VVSKFSKFAVFQETFSKLGQETFSKLGECLIAFFNCGGFSSGVEKDCASCFL
jgi:hypothetical protein